MYDYASELGFCAKPIAQIAVHSDGFSCPSAPHLHRLLNMKPIFHSTLSLLAATVFLFKTNQPISCKEKLDNCFIAMRLTKMPGESPRRLEVADSTTDQIMP